MILALATFFQLLAASFGDDFEAPLGIYSPRSRSTADSNVKLTFLDNGRVEYEVLTPQSESSPFASFPASMVSSSVVSVVVTQFQLDYWRMYHPGSFEDLGLQIFFYDAATDRITVNSIGRAFEILHSSDPGEGPGSVADVRKPNGMYRAVERGIDITIEFVNGRVTYNFEVGDVSYSFPFDVDFSMGSSSLIKVFVPRSQLHGLHGRFPGLSEDYFYTNLGYDPAKDEITFLLESWRAVILRLTEPSSPPARTRIPTTTSTSTTTTSNAEDRPHRPFGDYCVDRHTAKMSLSFKDQYTVTFAAVYRDTHLLARGARYDVIEESGQVVISVDAVNSDLNGELRKMDWHGMTRLNFIFDPVQNVVMLEDRGLIAHMYIGLECAAAIESPPAKPSGGGGGSSGTHFGDLSEFIKQVLEQLLQI
ncbi:hypothetical protein FOL47_003422 [Perkinsus chesapeaki]|uniref:Uncharacterized protein n=1 Tax=Perkinsus chesapeaki TaxID=330153 RepID=A0A7J6M808_PERCH|nr:hypothetical protein FOL47_003422 [Perkinsus chesapeaki]